jgi:hypothetical protein
VAIPEAGGRQLAVGGAAGQLVPGGQRKVARFITADAAQSTLALAPDGQLPTLALVDTTKVEKDTTEGSSINPLVLIVGIAASFCVSVILLFSDFGGETEDPIKVDVRQRLERYYIGQREPLAPYQAQLRQAQQAYSRGDSKTAQKHYRKVLEMLRAEGGNRFGGVTGTPSGDKLLEDLVSRILSQDYSPEPIEEQ